MKSFILLVGNGIQERQANKEPNLTRNTRWRLGASVERAGRTLLATIEDNTNLR